MGEKSTGSKAVRISCHPFRGIGGGSWPPGPSVTKTSIVIEWQTIAVSSTLLIDDLDAARLKVPSALIDRKLAHLPPRAPSTPQGLNQTVYNRVQSTPVLASYGSGIGGRALNLLPKPLLDNSLIEDLALVRSHALYV
jgi:hypothetical protein